MGLRMPGHSDTVLMGGADVVLSKQELKDYQALLGQFYQKRIERLMANPNFSNLPASGRQDLFTRQLGFGRENAESQMRQQLRQPKKK